VDKFDIMAQETSNYRIADKTQAASVARQVTFTDFYDLHEILGKYVVHLLLLTSL